MPSQPGPLGSCETGSDMCPAGLVRGVGAGYGRGAATQRRLPCGSRRRRVWQPGGTGSSAQAARQRSDTCWPCRSTRPACPQRGHSRRIRPPSCQVLRLTWRALTGHLLEAEAMAGGPPSDEDLAPYRAAADAVALELFVSAVARELASIRQAVEAGDWLRRTTAGRRGHAATWLRAAASRPGAPPSPP
jgi:hypothetical protein